MIEITPLASSSRGNCYHITDGQTPLLLECGMKWKEIRQSLNFKTSNIAGCLVSHEHKDHCHAVVEVMKAGIDIYASRGTIDVLGIAGHRVQAIQARQRFNVGTWSVMPFETEHDAAEPFGFLLANQAGEKLLYATDTYYIRYRFRGLTHVMVECNYARDILYENIRIGVVPEQMKKRLLRSHFSLENVKEMLRSNDLSKVQEIWLLHLSDNNSNADRFKREITSITGKPVYIAG